MLRNAITDRTLFGAHEPERRAGLLTAAARWAETGVDLIQLREKDLSPPELLALCQKLRAVLEPYPSPPRLLLNLGLSSQPPSIESLLTTPGLLRQLDGLHLPSTHLSHPEALTPAELRTRFPHLPSNRPATISISCHTLPEIEAAVAANVDLILFGPIFGKQVSGESIHPGVGLEALNAACHTAAPTPVLALGGITHENTSACLTAGATGIAAIRLFATGETPSTPKQPSLLPFHVT